MPDEEDQVQAKKKKKLTTAADVRMHMAMAAKDKNKAAEKEIRDLRSIYTAYMKHGLLRPILESELGPRFFSKIPASKEELQFKLEDIRSVFNRAGIHDNIINILLGISSFAEGISTKHPELTGGHNLQGLTVVLAHELADMQQLIAEVECEYGGWLEAGLAKRLLMQLVRIAKNVADTNKKIAEFSKHTHVPAQYTTPPLEPTTPPPSAKGKRGRAHKVRPEASDFDFEQVE